MKLLLTSNGLSNPSIIRALEDLIGKPALGVKLIFIPTAANVSEGNKDWLLNDIANCKTAGFDVDIVDIADKLYDDIKKHLDNAEVLLFGGGDTYYLLDQISKSGLKEKLSELLKTKVYVGISAGSIATSPKIVTTSVQLFDEDKPGEVPGLGLVNFHFRPHYGSDHFPRVNKENMDRIAKEIGEPIYVADDMTAVKVVDGKIEVVSEGKYLIYNI